MNVHLVRIGSQDTCASGVVVRPKAFAHTAHMARPGDKPPHFIRQWRKHRHLTLEQLAERIGMTHQNLGKIERFQVPYGQHLLEALAEELRATPADIINIDPTKEDAVWSIYETLTAPQRRQAAAMLRVIQGDRTGTDEG